MSLGINMFLGSFILQNIFLFVNKLYDHDSQKNAVKIVMYLAGSSARDLDLRQTPGVGLIAGPLGTASDQDLRRLQMDSDLRHLNNPGPLRPLMDEDMRNNQG
jgi:hypothetical protein